MKAKKYSCKHYITIIFGNKNAYKDYFIEDEKGFTETVKIMLNDLGERGKYIIANRHLVDNKTLSEIGEKFDITKERVRQIEAKAIRILRNPVRVKRLKEIISLYSPGYSCNESKLTSKELYKRLLKAQQAKHSLPPLKEKYKFDIGDFVKYDKRKYGKIVKRDFAYKKEEWGNYYLIHQTKKNGEKHKRPGKDKWIQEKYLKKQ